MKHIKDGLFFANIVAEPPVPVKAQEIENFAPHLLTGNIGDVRGSVYPFHLTRKKMPQQRI